MAGDPVNSCSQHRTTYRHENPREGSLVVQHTMIALNTPICFYPHGVTHLHKQYYGENGATDGSVSRPAGSIPGRRLTKGDLFIRGITGSGKDTSHASG